MERTLSIELAIRILFFKAFAKMVFMSLISVLFPNLSSMGRSIWRFLFSSEASIAFDAIFAYHF
jgi:hypothetical protein